MAQIQHHATITRFTHYFSILHPTPAVLRVIYSFSGEYTQHSLQFCKKSRKKRWLPYKTFGLYIDHGREFRFHIGQFDEFMRLLNQNFVDPSSYVIVDADVYEPEKIDIEIQDNYILRDDQEEASEFVINGGRTPVLLMGTGTGKAQPLTSPVKVPGGWKQMGDFSLGDRITAWDGTTTYVTGVYPKGTLPIYKVTFEDGRSTECCLDHLWKVHSNHFRTETRVISTLEVARLLKLPSYKDRLYVDLPSPEECEDVKLPLDPYILGLFLGDGCLKKNQVMLSSPDEEIVEHLRSSIPKELKLRKSGLYDYVVSGENWKRNENPYLRIFRELGLSGKRSWEKHIPSAYLSASVKQRLAIIQGLLDTDGTVDRKTGTVSFTSTSKELTESFVYLIRSIGGLAKTTSRISSYSHNNEKRKGRLAYTVFVRYKKPSDLFRLTRKKDLTNDENQYAASLKLRIRNIEFVGHKPAQCISVAHKDHLYVTDDFIVTHNTVTSLTSVAKRGFRFVVRVQAMYVDKWVNDIMEILKIDRSEICPIKGSDILQRATNYPESGMTMPKAFVVSISTMSSWCKLYEEDINNPRLEAYACSPSDFCQHLGVGTEIYDEAHLHPHAVYRNMCFTHVPKIIVLTATLLTKDPILRRVQSAMFPRVGRFEKIKMKRYITVHAASYQIFNFHGSKIQTTEQGQKNYSHAAFEKSIISNPKILRQYLKMITDMVLRTYFVDKAPGDTMMVFVATKRMADVVYARFKELWPEFDIRRYLQENDYPDILEPEIVITTIISGGTAIDKKDLRHVINTISIDSPNANAQVLGRLREMKHRETQNDVHFHYFYSSSIPKQVEYHRNKLELLQERVKEIKHELLDPIIP